MLGLDQGARDYTFLIDMGGELECISVDCLKPAYLNLDCPVVVAQLPHHCRPPIDRPHPQTGFMVTPCLSVPAGHLPAVPP